MLKVGFNILASVFRKIDASMSKKLDQPTKKRFLILIFFILALAIFLRLHRLSYLPCGFAPEESDVALWAINEGPAFIYNNPFNEPEGFFISLVSLVFYFLSPSVWGVYLASAILGILTIGLLLFAFTKHFNLPVAFYAALFMTTSSWHLALSQSGTRTITTPFFLALLILTIPQKEDLRKISPAKMFLLGVIFSLGFYGYLNYRAIIVVLPLLLFMHSYANVNRSFFTFIKSKSLISFLLGSLIPLIPLIIGYYHFPQTFMGRLNQVAINKPFLLYLEQIARNTIAIIKGFLIQSENDWRHVLNQQAYLHWATIFPIFLGLIWALFKTVLLLNTKEKNIYYSILFPSFLIFLIPSLMSEDALNGARLGGTIIFLSLFFGIGLFIITTRIKSKVLTWGTISLMVWLLPFSAVRNLNYREINSSYARNYFCDVNQIGMFITDPKLKFAQKISSQAEVKKSHIVFLGTWYDFAPLWFYLRSSEFSIKYYSYEELFTDRNQVLQSLDEKTLVLIPAYSEYLSIRYHSWKEKPPTGQSLLELFNLKYPNSEKLYEGYSTNKNWYPDGVTFIIYEVK